MSRAVHLPDDLYKRTAALAAVDRKTIDEFVAALVENQLAALDFIQSRARLFDRQDFDRALASIPDTDAEEADRL